MATGAATAVIPSLPEISFGAVRGSARPAETNGNGAAPIRLSRNENAYGPSARVTAAMQEAATDGGCEVENRNGRARAYRKSTRSRLPQT